MKWLERVGNPLEWRDIDKALIVQGIVAPAMVGAAFRTRYLLMHPSVEPYYDRGMLELVNWVIVGFLVLTAVLTAIGLRLRRRAGRHRLYLHILNQTWWITYAVLAYLHGLATTPLWAIFPFLGFFCLLLFGAELTAAGVLSSLGLIYATTIAERAGLIPYAPFFRELPLVDGRVADTWMWSSMIWPVAVSAVTFVVFAFLLARAREQAVRDRKSTRLNSSH